MAYEGYIVGMPNLLRDAACTISGSSLWTQPVANLGTARPSEFAKLPTLDPTEALIKFVTGEAGDQIDVFGLVGVNFTPGATFRIGINGTLPTGATLEDLAPDSIAASTNATGAVGDIDEDPFSLDANKISQTSAASAMTVRVTFPTPASIPALGASLQAFYVAAKGSGTLVTSTMNVQLYEAGSLVLDLGTQALTGATTKVYGYYWDADLLGTGSGADVQALITLSAIDGGSGELHAVKWACDESGYGYDTGYLTIPAWNTDPVTGLDVTLTELGPPPQRTLRHIFPSLQTVGYSLDFHVRDIANPAGYLQAGVAMAGRKFAAAISPVDYGGDLINTVDLSVKQRTPGGQILSTNRVKWDEVGLRFKNTTAEAFSLRDRLMQRRGTTQPVLFIGAPTGTAYEQQYLDKYGVLKAQTAMRPMRTAVPHWEQSFTLEEAL